MTEEPIRTLVSILFSYNLRVPFFMQIDPGTVYSSYLQLFKKEVIGQSNYFPCPWQGNRINKVPESGSIEDFQVPSGANSEAFNSALSFKSKSDSRVLLGSFSFKFVCTTFAICVSCSWSGRTPLIDPPRDSSPTPHMFEPNDDSIDKIITPPTSVSVVRNCNQTKTGNLNLSHKGTINGLNSSHKGAINGLNSSHKGAINGLNSSHRGAINGNSSKKENRYIRYNSLEDKFEDSYIYNLENQGGFGGRSIYASEESEKEGATIPSRSQVGLRETNCLLPNLSRSDADTKKRVRFSFAKMEGGGLNFRVTLSIKNEANGQTVFYKVDKNRFRKEKTIKLMVETLYRVDISFKPTQTLARAIVSGHEVKMTERVHDSTASAYSLHLPTSNVVPTPKGHREEISFLIQLTNGLVLQMFLQVKFYKPSDTQHCEWGSTFHCIEYDCESYTDTAAIAVLRETFR